MKELRRPRVELPTLTGDGKGARAAAEHHRRASEATSKTELKFADHWNEPDVRGALHAMHGRVCAYCQCELTRSDPGDVDHFRPKKGELDQRAYWWLAYVFDNYLLACRACNSWRKGARFPLEAGATPCCYEDRDAISSEARLLLDPVFDPVETWMRVDWMDEDKGCFVKESNKLPHTSIGRTRTRETIQFFRLNGDPDLYRDRLRALQRAQRTYKDWTLRPAETRNVLQRLASRFHPHGIWVRQFLEDIEPSLLPTREQELFWLLDDIHERLEDAIKLQQHSPDDARLCAKIIKELCWALAVLWKDPPAASREEIEQWLDNKQWKEAVQPFYDKLCRAAVAL